MIGYKISLLHFIYLNQLDGLKQGLTTDLGLFLIYLICLD